MGFHFAERVVVTMSSCGLRCSRGCLSLAETQLPFSSKKQCAGKAAGLELNKDPDFNFGSNVLADGVFRATNQG